MLSRFVRCLSCSLGLIKLQKSSSGSEKSGVCSSTFSFYRLRYEKALESSESLKKCLPPSFAVLVDF